MWIPSLSHRLSCSKDQWIWTRSWSSPPCIPPQLTPGSTKPNNSKYWQQLIFSSLHTSSAYTRFYQTKLQQILTTTDHLLLALLLSWQQVLTNQTLVNIDNSWSSYWNPPHLIYTSFYQTKYLQQLIIPHSWAQWKLSPLNILLSINGTLLSFGFNRLND